MIATAVLVFLLGTAVTAGPYVPSFTIEKYGASDIKEQFPPSVYFPFIANNLITPQIFNLLSQLPLQLQPIINAIEKDDCKKSLPIVSPFIVEEFIKKPVNFEEMLNLRAAHFIALPVTASDERLLIIPEPPKLPKLSTNDLKRFQEKVLKFFVENEEPKKTLTHMVIPPAPTLPPLQLPELPIELKVQNVPALPCQPAAPLFPVQVNVIENNKKDIKTPIVVLAAPLLPSIEFPKLTAPLDDLPTISLPMTVPLVVEQYKEPRKPLPEPPKLPELSNEDLERLKNKIPERMVEYEEPKKDLILEVIPIAPKLPALDLPKLPTTVEINQIIPSSIFPVYVEREEHPEIKNPIVIPSAPILPLMESPKLQVQLQELPAISPHVSVPIIVAEREELKKSLPEPPKLPELSNEDLERLKSKVPERMVEYEEPKKDLIPEVIPIAPQIPALDLPKLPTTVEINQIIPSSIFPVYVEREEHLEIKNPIVIPSAPILPLMESPKLQVQLEELPAISPHVAVPIIVAEREEVKKSLPEPPKLPELSNEDLERLKSKVPERMVEYEELKKTMTTEAIPIAPELPVLELPKTAAIVEVNQILLPEPPKLPELSNEDLERLKSKVPERMVEYEEPIKDLIPETIPIGPELPALDLLKFPTTVEINQIIPSSIFPVYVEREEHPEIKNPIVISSAPVLPLLEFPKLQVQLEDTPDISPHFSVPLLVAEEEVVKKSLPEPPKLPELSNEDLEHLKSKVPERMVEYEALKKPITTEATPIAPELPALKLPKIPAIVEVNQILLPEPPKLPELSNEDLERLKSKVPERMVEYEEPKKDLIPEAIPIGPELPALDLSKLPTAVEVNEIIPSSIYPFYMEREEIKNPIVIPSAPVLPLMEIPKLQVQFEEIPAISPHVSVPVIVADRDEIKKPLPEPPKLPELSSNDLELLKNRIPEYMEENKESKIPSLPINVQPIFIEIEKEKETRHPIVIPAGPELPSVKLSEVLKVVEKQKHLNIPESPKYTSNEFLDEQKKNQPEPVVVEVEGQKLPFNSFVLPPIQSGAIIRPYPIFIPVLPEQNTEFLSIPRFYQNKHCVDEIVLKRIMPEMEKDLKKISSPSLSPVPYVGPVGFKLLEL